MLVIDLANRLKIGAGMVGGDDHEAIGRQVLGEEGALVARAAEAVRKDDQRVRRAGEVGRRIDQRRSWPEQRVVTVRAGAAPSSWAGYHSVACSGRSASSSTISRVPTVYGPGAA